MANVWPTHHPKHPLWFGDQFNSCGWFCWTRSTTSAARRCSWFSIFILTGAGWQSIRSCLLTHLPYLTKKEVLISFIAVFVFASWSPEFHDDCWCFPLGFIFSVGSFSALCWGALSHRCTRFQGCSISCFCFCEWCPWPRAHSTHHKLCARRFWSRLCQKTYDTSLEFDTLSLFQWCLDFHGRSEALIEKETRAFCPFSSMCWHHCRSSPSHLVFPEWLPSF